MHIMSRENVLLKAIRQKYWVCDITLALSLCAPAWRNPFGTCAFHSSAVRVCLCEQHEPEHSVIRWGDGDNSDIPSERDQTLLNRFV